MRMDNETYRLRVEALLRELGREEDALSSEALAELERLALTPRKARYFLRALLATEQSEPIQVHFYRLIMEAARTKNAYSDLERHIRHAFYEAREVTRSVLAQVQTPRALTTLFHVIALTEEGWLAGELIRIVLAMPVEVLQEPLHEALMSEDYLLQCLAIYLIGKTADENLLNMLARFYRKPVGERIDRLEKKSYDALLEGAQTAVPSLFTTWLKDKSVRVRDLALTVLATREVPEVVVDLAGLVLIDAHTRTKASKILLRYAEADVFEWSPEDPRGQQIRRLLTAAKEDALVRLLRSLLRHESPAVREVAIQLVGLLPEAASTLVSEVSRLSVEEPLPALQIAALKVIERIAPELLVSSLVEVYADHGFGQGSPELLSLANQIMQRSLTPEQVLKVQEGIEEKKERRAAALERFAGSVEWWRHEV